MNFQCYHFSNCNDIDVDVKIDINTSLNTVISYIRELGIFPDSFSYYETKIAYTSPYLVFENNNIKYESCLFFDQMYKCQFPAFIIKDEWTLAIYQVEVVKLNNSILKDIERVIKMYEVVLMPIKDEGKAFTIFDESYMEKLG